MHDGGLITPNGEWGIYEGWMGVGEVSWAPLCFWWLFFGQNFTGLEGKRQGEKRIVNNLVWMNGFTQP
jgi:hypothetical protein